MPYKDRNKKLACARNSKYKTKFGITVEEYDKMYILQKGYCAICGKHQIEFTKRFAVDHDHKTNKVRGLLCQNCNLTIGFANDDIIILKKTIKYLTAPTKYEKVKHIRLQLFAKDRRDH